MNCKFCDIRMIISKISEDEYEAECNKCGYLINWGSGMIKCISCNLDDNIEIDEIDNSVKCYNCGIQWDND